MKKLYYTLLLFSLTWLFSGRVYGQKERSKTDEIIIGVVAGGTLSKISNYDANSIIGFIGGIYLEFRFSEKLSMMPNILYAERGAEGLKLAYLSIPIVLKYNISDKMAIGTGIAWDDLIAVNGKGFSSNDYNIYDWRIPVTVGYNITRHLSIGLNYNFGLSDISKNDNMKMKNNWGSLALAYKIYSFKK